ncbi:hypothetical protein SE17_26830 [Kouleothrix aurantiaca]|uniref:4-amino-4-deoxy-L-arabinose transferase n=1 Tax=Kouleothrix aurantiaca TaxID=186479 RepID=A0A0P9D5L3_9CHLR|nr:hypothetical protein SE17_26830 [Kouleothrix aurantiaca]
MSALKNVNLALRFVLELCALVALGYWGFATQPSLLLKWLLGIGAPLLAAVVWGVFGSPRASIPVRGLGQIALEALVFGSGALALVLAGHPLLGAILAGLLVINRVLIHFWGGDFSL